MRSKPLLFTALILLLFAGTVVPAHAAPLSMVMIDAENEPAVAVLDSAGAPVWSSSTGTRFTIASRTPGMEEHEEAGNTGRSLTSSHKTPSARR